MPPSSAGASVCGDRIQRFSARPVSAGDGITSQGRDFGGPPGLRRPGQTDFFQFLIDPPGGPIRPANDGCAPESACKCNQRRHRTILVVHGLRPLPALSPRAGDPAIGICGTKWRIESTPKSRISPIPRGFPVPRSLVQAAPQTRRRTIAIPRRRICDRAGSRAGRSAA